MTEHQMEYMPEPAKSAVPAHIENQPTGYMALIEKAVSSGAGVDVLEKMMALHERHEANEARKAYHKAMAAFKADPPEIYKDSEVDFTSQKGRTNYTHATLANVAGKINSALSQHGLSASWKTDQSEKGITVTCRIVHELGHYEETCLTAGPDMTGNKNSIQAIGSTVSYLQRYTILALTGLATKEMDDDGRGGEPEYITTDQMNIITDTLRECGVSEARFVKLLNARNIAGIEDIPAGKWFEWAIKTIRKATPDNAK